MSLTLNITNNILIARKIKLPTRYYHFNDSENYIKLLHTGDGFFPEDKIHTTINLLNSNFIITTESASKVYPSNKTFAINKINLKLKNSNLEFIGDELILFKNSKFIQFLTLNFDKTSTFFYCDILSGGRSYEEYGFSELKVKNRFLCCGFLEYLERFEISGDFLKEYARNHLIEKSVFAKIYIKTKNNDLFAESLVDNDIKSFTYTQNKSLIMAIVLGDKISRVKTAIYDIWKLYRKTFNKAEFDLGKQ